MANLLQLHGVAEKGASPAIAAPAHDILPLEGFDAIVSSYTLDTDTAKVSPDDLAGAAMTHHRILLAYCADHALLPSRFGTLFSGPSALRTAMAEHATAYVDALNVLADHREYSIELLVETRPETTPRIADSGRNFLSDRKQLRDRRRSLVQDRQSFARALCDKAASLSDHAVCLGAAKPEKLLDANLLLPTRALQELRTLAECAEAEAAALGLTLVLRGPWPAYHFDPSAQSAKAQCHDA